MTETLGKIESYFQGELSENEHLAFEKQILSDKNLAENVAFYLQTKQVAKAEAQERRKVDFEKIREQQKTIAPVRSLYVRYASIAASLALLVGMSWWFFSPKTSSTELASTYIQDNLTNISVAMDGQKDSLQHGIGLFNEGKLAESQIIFEHLPNNAEAQKMAGIVALRIEKYEEAIQYFKKLSSQKELYANPGIFLEAITLLKRNQGKDTSEAKLLLEQVVQQKLEGAKEAERILNGIKN
jgi:tetratricopeptide (TPR) repeat protein